MIHSLLWLIVLGGCAQVASTPQAVKADAPVQATPAPGPTTPPASGGFQDQTQAYGLAGVKARHFYAVDANFDGATDLIILPALYQHPQLWLFDPTLKKFERASWDPFPEKQRATHLYIYDLNGDTIPEVLVGHFQQKNQQMQKPMLLFEGRREKGQLQWTHRPQAVPLENASSPTAQLLDYNLDGKLDLFVGQWWHRQAEGSRTLPDSFFEGHGLEFQQRSDLLRGEWEKSEGGNIYPQARPTFGSSLCDINGDGLIDILTASTHGHGNKLWINREGEKKGERWFQDYGHQSLYASDDLGRLASTGGGRTFFCACADYNNDSLIDVYLGELSHSYDDETIDKSSVLTGIKPGPWPEFLRTEYLKEDERFNWNQGDKRGAWIDLNFDGLLDLLVENTGFPPSSRLIAFEQLSDHSFSNQGPQWGLDVVNPSGTIYLDVNQDGRLDLLTAQLNTRLAQLSERPYLLVNNLPWDGKKTIKVTPTMQASNSQALGASVVLKGLKNGVPFRRWQILNPSQGGLPSQHENGLWFGLQKDERPLELEVTFPILASPRAGTSLPLVQRYSLKKWPPLTNHLSLKACSDGRAVSFSQSC